jgi:hypothetical protein
VAEREWKARLKATKPQEPCAKFGWRQLAGLLRRAAEGQQDVAVVSDALRFVLKLEGVPCR